MCRVQLVSAVPPFLPCRDGRLQWVPVGRCFAFCEAAVPAVPSGKALRQEETPLLSLQVGFPAWPMRLPVLLHGGQMLELDFCSAVQPAGRSVVASAWNAVPAEPYWWMGCAWELFAGAVQGVSRSAVPAWAELYRRFEQRAFAWSVALPARWEIGWQA